MLQIFNCSDQILYEKEQEYSEILKVINSTVSHELRNPLNSLVQYNLMKQSLYKDLRRIIKNSEISSDTKKQMNEIMTKLDEGLKV